MPKNIHLKFLSWALLVVMMTVTVNGVNKCAHAMQSHAAVANVQSVTSPPEVSASHHCPCSPLEQHNDSEDCDSCINCTCHVHLNIQPFQLSYNPIISEINTCDTFTHLPEVYLPKFIPPQNLA